MEDCNDNCPGISGDLEFSCCPGYDEYEIVESVVIYPNPTNGGFTLEADFGELVEANIDIRNVLGQSISSEVVNASTLRKTFDLSSLSNGVYLVVIETEKGRVARRITKQ